MKTDITLPGGPTVEADVTKENLLAVHRPLGSKQGYVITDIATGRVYTWVRLKKDALQLRALLEKVEDQEGRLRLLIATAPRPSPSSAREPGSGVAMGSQGGGGGVKSQYLLKGGGRMGNGNGKQSSSHCGGGGQGRQSGSSMTPQKNGGGSWKQWSSWVWGGQSSLKNE